MKALCIYVVRDLLYATYPNYLTDAKIKQQDQVKIVWIQNQAILKVTQQGNEIELQNIQVPYLMMISPIDAALESDGVLNAQ